MQQKSYIFFQLLGSFSCAFFCFTNSVKTSISWAYSYQNSALTQTTIYTLTTLPTYFQTTCGKRTLTGWYHIKIVWWSFNSSLEEPSTCPVQQLRPLITILRLKSASIWSNKTRGGQWPRNFSITLWPCSSTAFVIPRSSGIPIRPSRSCSRSNFLPTQFR